MPTLHCRSPALSSSITPPMAAGMSTSQGTVRTVSLGMTTPPANEARLHRARAARAAKWGECKK